MKKILSIALLAAGLCSCANSEEAGLALPEDKNVENSIPTRSIDDAVQITNGLLANESSNARSQVTVSRENVSVICSKSSRNGSSDTLMYAVNHGDNQGFTLVSAPKNVVPVIAYTEQGDFDSKETINNEAFQYALQKSQEYVQMGVVDGGNSGNDINAIEPLPFERYDYYDTIKIQNKVDPRIIVKWGQGWPENMYSPNGFAGCGPVAIAQIASYFRMPTAVTLSYPDKDVNEIQLNWSSLKMHLKSLSYSNPNIILQQVHWNNCNSSQENHHILARFVRELGHLSGSSYNEDYTFTSFDNLNDLLEDLYPESVRTSGTYSNGIYNLLYEDGVALYIGETTDDIRLYWVADGVLRLKYIISYYRKNTQAPPEYRLISREEIEHKYIHFNWGLAGNSNGYFLEGVFDTSQRSYNDSFNNPPTINPLSRTAYDQDVRYTHIKLVDN